MSSEVAASIRIPWSSLLSREELIEHVGRYPGMSWYVPGTSSYLVAGPWRNRREIVEVYETRGERLRHALWRSLLANASEPYGAVLVDPSEYRAAAHFYRHVGVGAIEDVLALRTGALPGPAVEITLQITPMRSKGLEDVLRVDHSAFPWLWRNSREEFEEYLNTPGVRLLVGAAGGESVGYIGFTEFNGWGHIDRLAVRAESHGRGYGSQLLSWTLRRLHEAGARYVQLSTQESNARSQGLYTRFGFKQTRGSYRVYGVFLDRRGR